MPDNLRITVDEVRKRMGAGEQFAFIDTRNPQAWGESDVKLPGAIRLPVDKFEEHISEIPKDRPIISYCTWPNEGSSASLAQKLRQRGYENVWARQGGLGAWRDAGLPLDSKAKAA
jgi:rhodanese-related sulfurtransferase